MLAQASVPNLGCTISLITVFLRVDTMSRGHAGPRKLDAAESLRLRPIGASATVGIQIVQPWELESCKCPIVSRRIQVPGETRQRCFECLKPCNNDITICAHASDAANIANSPAAANAGRPGDDGPPLAALPNGTTADAGLEHSNVTPLAEESQRSCDTYGDDSQRGIYGVSCQC